MSELKEQLKTQNGQIKVLHELRRLQVQATNSEDMKNFQRYRKEITDAGGDVFWDKNDRPSYVRLHTEFVAEIAEKLKTEEGRDDIIAALIMMYKNKEDERILQYQEVIKENKFDVIFHGFKKMPIGLKPIIQESPEPLPFEDKTLNEQVLELIQSFNNSLFPQNEAEIKDFSDWFLAHGGEVDGTYSETILKKWRDSRK